MSNGQTLTVKVEGHVSGTYPIGQLTELLYAMIDYLETHDRKYTELQSWLPLKKTFKVEWSKVTLEIADTDGNG